MVFSSVHSGDSGGSGSCWNTSRKAPPSRPAARASISAASSMAWPRATLTIEACAGRAASAWRSTSSRVAGVSGQASTSQSAPGSSPARSL
ncbi:hypothetical protein G6F52_014026 [Rhizopus delemar]|nr:hypothetical protein G6F68_019552 [Rhizopus microsporus]KAG1488089.1 hypothetical protein G6F52_014026 [Rhizopus delemar]